MKNRLLFLILFFASFFTEIKASHIVGGNFEMVYSGRGYFYNVYMDMFYDDINAAAGLLDADLTINIVVYSKATNNYIKDFQLVRPKADNSDFITYSNNGCTDPKILRTRLFRYTGSVDLSGLNEPQGYYISWERCCRNYETLNIVHTDPYGNYISGQVFYLEFPPSVKGGTHFVNSSPVFGKVPAQYLCQNNYIQMDFSATDNDHDSLVYRLVDPKQGHTTNADAILLYPLSAPYKPITWEPGYSATNAIHGNPSLTLNSQTGILSVDPSELGLFAFSMVCDEYRNGVKIGEVQRDFQFLVKDCPPVHPPSVGLNASNHGSSSSGSTNWGNLTPDTLVVKLNRDTCYTIFVTDSSSSFYNMSKQESISYGSTNLPHSVLSFTPTYLELTPSVDTSTMQMCFSPCDKILITRDSVYYLDIIVKNDGNGPPDYCNQKSDTLRTYIHVIVDENNTPPKISTSLDSINNSIVTHPDSLVQFYVYGTDVDPNDIKVIDAEGYRFRLSEYRMSFKKVYQGTDSIAYLFKWTPNCTDMTSKLLYRIDFSLKDSSCIYTHKDTTSVTIRLRDVDTGLENLHPSNLITPNGDGFNDCFHLPNLPPDNCTVKFKSVEIFNRWGARIFVSSDRNFKWCAEDISDGIYYYSIDLTTKRVKEWIQVMK